MSHFYDMDVLWKEYVLSVSMYTSNILFIWEDEWRLKYNKISQIT